MLNLKYLIKYYFKILTMDKYKSIFIISFIILFGTILFYSLILSWKINCDHVSDSITIEKGYSVHDVSLILENNLCLNTLIFKIAMKITFNEKNIKYGRYDLKSLNNVRDLVQVFTSISKERNRITIFEGLRMQEIALILNKKMNIDIEKFLSMSYDRSFIKTLGFDDSVNNLEGYLYPDTYIFLHTYTEEDIIRIMTKQFLYNYNEYVKNTTKLNTHEIVTLASIIQGEAVYEDEMKTISSVYHNRLNKDMLLQADPTIQYLLPKHKSRLLYDDTQIDHAYNTYKNKGLPPGPINSPGIAALIAAADPIKTKYLYFVSNNYGRHIFNTNYKEHLRAK